MKSKVAKNYKETNYFSKRFIKEKVAVASYLLKHNGVLKAILLSGIYTLYHLHKYLLLKKDRKLSMSPKKIKLFTGQDFYISMQDSGLSFDLNYYQKREPVATDLMLKLARNRKPIIFMDIGANLGYYSKLLEPYCSKIIAVEPNKRALPHLYKNLGKNEKIRILEGAVGTTKNLYLQEKQEFNLSSIHTTKGNYKVKTYNLYDLLKKYKPNLIKMDIEGYEFSILNENLKKIKSLPEILFVEVHFNKTTKETAIKLFENLRASKYKVGWAIWEHKGPHYLTKKFVIWKFLDKLLVKIFGGKTVLCKNMDIDEFITEYSFVLEGKLGAIEFIFERKE